MLDLASPYSPLLVLACMLLWCWQRSEPSRVLFVLPLVVVVVAVGLSVWQVISPGRERAIAVTMFACVAAVILPALLMMRPLFERLAIFVFPRARLVRSKRSRG